MTTTESDDRRLIERLLQSVRRQAGVDAAYLVEYRPDGARVRVVAGDGAMVGVVAGQPLESTGSVCLAVAAGRVPAILEDTRVHRTARRLAWDQPRPIGAFGMAPVRQGDGGLYGSLCVAHRRPATLGPAFGNFLAAMADVVGGHLDDQAEVRRRSHHEREAVLRLFDDGRMSTALQPIVDVATGRTLGVEALTRFASERRLPPNVWFAAAARQGLGLELEAAAISRALRLLPRLPTSWYLAVNASPALVESEVLGDLLLDGVTDRIVVEITEHAAVRNYAGLAARLDGLRGRGVRVAVDDAGAGFSSLRHVLEVRPDVIKIDGSIVRGLDRAPLQRAMIDTLGGFAVRASAMLVAEAVETPDELAVLQQLGVPAAQGYLFASPGTPDDLREVYPVAVPAAVRSVGS